MENKTCPKCKIVFKYASRLKTHFQLTIHCKKTDSDIQLYFSSIKDKVIDNIHNNTNNTINNTINNNTNNTTTRACIPVSLSINNDNDNNTTNINNINNINNTIVNNKIHKCDKCNTIFTFVHNLQRHIKNSKCSRKTEQEEREKQIAILQKQIDDLKNQNTLSQSITQPANIQPTTQQIQIINNNHNERIINNNLTINNTIVQHIYPLGYEKLPNISQSEMLRLLELGDEGVIEIVKLVCEQDENKNFYKINMNKNNISFLSNKYKIDVCQETQLKQTLLKQCVILTYQMLIACSPILSSDKIYSINSNLQNMSSKMKEEIYENGLKNIIEYELRNNNKITKDKIKKYTKEINDNSNIKEQALLNYNNVLQIKDNTVKSLSPEITLSNINNKLGDPVSLPEMSYEFTYRDFDTKRFEETTYLKYWKLRIKNELKYIKSQPTVSLCDFSKFEERKNDIESKLQLMETQSKQMREYDNNNNRLVNKDNFKVLIPQVYIIENQRNK